MLRRWIPTWVQRFFRSKRNMRHYRLGREERISTGFTDVFTVYKTDFHSTTVGVPESVILAPLAVGDLVMNNTLIEVIVPAAGLGQADGSTGLASGGSLVGASNLLAAGNRYFASPNSSAPRPAVAATNLVFDLTPGGAEAPGAITAGEFRVWVSISRKADRNFQA